MEKIACFLAFAVFYVNANAINVGNLNNGVDRITNGNFAADTQFPYVVSIQDQTSVVNSTTRGHRCGGVLITLQHVLTTASCTYDIVNGTAVPINPGAFRVFGGSAILTNDALPDRFRPISNITAHPQHYIAPSLLNDIAVITLSAPFPNNGTVIPIPLPAADFDPEDFTVCSVSGWGASNLDDTASVELRFAGKYVYSQQLCTKLYNSMFGIANIFPSMICAASFDILSSGCTGDKGNPLVCNGQLTGLLSFTNNCQASSFPEIYTRVSNYTTWIRSVTGGTSTYKPGFVILLIFTLLQFLSIKIFN